MSEPRDRKSPSSTLQSVASRLQASASAQALFGGRYELGRILGEGGMGTVYEALDRQISRNVAIKLMSVQTAQDPAFLARFRREVAITSKLRHPSTVRVYEHGETSDGRPYMVMELLTGQSLASYLQQGALPEDVALGYALQIAESLSEAHAHGIFHRDLKPENLLIETLGVSKVVKVVDFGIASDLEHSRITHAGEVFGTPHYMSPEQCRGEAVDARSDLYALGCILFEMIEGHPPFTGAPMAIMHMHVHNKPPRITRASEPTRELIGASLRKEPKHRIPSAEVFVKRVKACISALETEAAATKTSAVKASTRAQNFATSLAPQSKALALRKPPSKSPWKSLTLTGMAVAGGLAGVYMVFRSPASTEPASSVSEKPADLQLPRNRAVVDLGVKGAEVFVDDKSVGKTPCEISIPVGDGVAHEVRVRKAGYKEVKVLWRPASVTESLPAFPSFRPTKK